MSRLQRSIINMLSSMTGYAVPMLVNFFVTPWLLSALGQAGYGLQSLVGVITGYLAVMDMGLDVPICKFLAEDRAREDFESENQLLSTTLQLYWLIGLIGTITIMLGAGFLASRVFMIPQDTIGQAKTVFLIAGIGFFANVQIKWGDSVTGGLQRYDLMNGMSLMTMLVGIGIGISAVYAGYGVVGYVSARVGTSVLAGLIYLVIARSKLVRFRISWGLDKSSIKRVRDYIGSGILLRISSFLTNGLDRTLIGAWLGLAAVGVYAIPMQILSAVGGLTSKSLGFTFPMASELYSLGQHDALRDIFIRASRFIAAMASMIYIPFLVFGDIFLTLWVGSEMALRATTPLRFIALAGLLGNLAVTLSNNIAVGTGHIREYTVYALVRSGVVSLGLFILIRPFGIVGASAAFLIANLIEWMFFVYVIHKYLQLKLVKLLRLAYMKPLLLAIITAVLAYFSRPIIHSWLNFGLVTLGFELIYVVAGFGIGVFGETERRLIAGLWKSVRSSVSKVAANV